MNKVLAIVGPTASGKSALAIKIAKKYGGEIICADSRTIYKGLDIGTAKPSAEEQSQAKHHGLDLINPDEKFSVADFQKLAREWIAEIESRGKLPIIVGGTGLYVDALLYNYGFSAKNSKRDEINPRHLSKEVEVKKDSLIQGAVIIGLDPGKEELDKRIKMRAEQMKQSGVAEEAKLLGEKYGWDSPGASGNIYQALRLYLEGASSLEECLERFVILDRQLAKRQRTWFKRNPDIHWFTSPELAEQFLDSEL